MISTKDLLVPLPAIVIALLLAGCTSAPQPKPCLNGWFPPTFEYTLMQSNPDYEQEVKWGILITGTEDYIRKMTKALKLVRDNDPANWTLVLCQE